MSSPFPGMDPFLESQVWPDFHLAVVAYLREWLIPRVRPDYVVRSEERVYLEHQSDDRPKVIRPDVTIAKPEGWEPASGGISTSTVATSEPVVLTLPIPEQETEVYLTIRERATMDLVTIIEVLSPGNKRPGSDGRREYLSKREAVLRSHTNLVELDLLLRGQRLPTDQPLPPADYYAFVARGNRLPRVEVYYWTLAQSLPSVPIPLKGKDPDVVVDLQSVLNTVYDRAGYDYSLDYKAALDLGLSETQMANVNSVLKSASPGDSAAPATGAP